MIYIAVLNNSTESLRTSLQQSNCSLDLMPLPQYGTLAWRPSQGTKLYCLVNRGTLGVNNLPRVVARIMPRPESNLRPLDHESNALRLHYRMCLSILCMIVYVCWCVCMGLSVCVWSVWVCLYVCGLCVSGRRTDGRKYSAERTSCSSWEAAGHQETRWTTFEQNAWPCNISLTV